MGIIPSPFFVLFFDFFSANRTIFMWQRQVNLSGQIQKFLPQFVCPCHRCKQRLCILNCFDVYISIAKVTHIYLHLSAPVKRCCPFYLSPLFSHGFCDTGEGLASCFCCSRVIPWQNFSVFVCCVIQ